MPTRIDRSAIPAAPDLSFESALWANQIFRVAGLDEAGRGAWAGPVCAAAVILPNDSSIEQKLAGVRDSKELSPQRRAGLAPVIKQYALVWGVGFSDNLEIDQYGIISATRFAMQRAVKVLGVLPDHLLIDALFLPDLSMGQTALIKGDQRSLSIAAASILAKTTRDAWMVMAHEDFPVYRFDRHKGYGTKMHQKMLAEHGICELHRSTYKPIQGLEKPKA
jgi:ribonuclease HII